MSDWAEGVPQGLPQSFCHLWAGPWTGAQTLLQPEESQAGPQPTAEEAQWQRGEGPGAEDRGFWWLQISARAW